MHPRFQTAFAQLADNLQSALEPILADKYFPALLTGEQVSSLKSATGLDEDALAFALLPLAAACARTPLSNFNVGAIARGVSGTWYFGANMEFIGATMQQTVHAEQSAISHAWLSGEKALAAITVNYTPCGHCRQFMNELNSGLDLRIHLPGREAHALRDYLPDAFGPKDLEIKTLLMDEQDHGYALTGDALSQAAIAAANRSLAFDIAIHSLQPVINIFQKFLLPWVKAAVKTVVFSAAATLKTPHSTRLCHRCRER